MTYQVLIFAGAGASMSVNPEKFPATLEFFERLPDEIKKTRSFNM
jgi:hypothetical protein